jgi:hypothetical protein
MPPETPKAFWRERPLWVAVLVALAIRTVAVAWLAGEPSGMAPGYVEVAGTLASGYGMMMKTPQADWSPKSNVVEVMKLRQAEGTRIDREHPFPPDLKWWVPATTHPPGYSMLLYGLYELGNYSGMYLAAHCLQVLFDSLTCVVIFLLARNVFSRRVGLVAAWGYAVLLPATTMLIELGPDAFGRFLYAVIFWLTSEVWRGKKWALPVTGMVIGLACYFRVELLLLAGPIFLILWIAGKRFGKAVVQTAVIVAVQALIWVPWLIWTQRVTGQAMLATTNGGGGMYQSLGEAPGNPWGITVTDEWVHQDAVKRGFPGAWSPQADAFYRKRFVECVKEHPGLYAKIVLCYRLPLALVPPYGPARSNEERQKLSFTKWNLEEGLTRWQAVRKYPGTIVAVYWSTLLMTGFSLVLTLSFLGAWLYHWRQFRTFAWLLIPWAYVIGTICLLKMISPKNVSATMVFDVIALAWLMVSLAEARRRKREAPTPPAA